MTSLTAFSAVGRIEFRGTDPNVHAVDAPIGHLNDFSTNYAVMLRRDAAQADSGADGLADGRLDRDQVGVSPQERADWNEVLGPKTVCDHGGLAAQCFHEQPVVGHGGILPSS